MADKPIKSTVRARKDTKKLSTQRMLPVAEVRNNTIVLKNGGLRAILAIEALNFNLKSETEQQGIIAGYGSFVNTITFPLQIVIRSTKTNSDDYLKQVHDIGEKQTNELLKNQTLSYVAFMQKLIEMADIMEKRFYVIVPVDHIDRRKTVFEQFFDWLHPDDSASNASVRSHEFGSASGRLTERVDLVSSGLTNIGLHVKRLTTRDLIEVLYQTYNPKTSQIQKMPKDTNDLGFEASAL